MDWQEYKHEFEFYGSWRDIYVLNTSGDDWQHLIDFCRSSSFELSYSVNGAESKLPSHIDEVFSTRDRAGFLLTVDVGSITFNCHFFMAGKIEFDFDPRKIENEFHAEQVFSFMQQVGEFLNKEVILTPENASNLVIFKYALCTKQVQYFPV